MTKPFSVCRLPLHRSTLRRHRRWSSCSSSSRNRRSWLRQRKGEAAVKQGRGEGRGRGVKRGRGGGRPQVCSTLRARGDQRVQHAAPRRLERATKGRLLLRRRSSRASRADGRSCRAWRSGRAAKKRGEPRQAGAVCSARSARMGIRGHSLLLIISCRTAAAARWYSCALTAP